MHTPQNDPNSTQHPAASGQVLDTEQARNERIAAALASYNANEKAAQRAGEEVTSGTGGYSIAETRSGEHFHVYYHGEQVACRSSCAAAFEYAKEARS